MHAYSRKRHAVVIAGIGFRVGVKQDHGALESGTHRDGRLINTFRDAGFFWNLDAGWSADIFQGVAQRDPFSHESAGCLVGLVGSQVTDNHFYDSFSGLLGGLLGKYRLIKSVPTSSSTIRSFVLIIPDMPVTMAVTGKPCSAYWQ